MEVELPGLAQFDFVQTLPLPNLRINLFCCKKYVSQHNRNEIVRCHIMWFYASSILLLWSSIVLCFSHYLRGVLTIKITISISNVSWWLSKQAEFCQSYLLQILTNYVPWVLIERGCFFSYLTLFLVYILYWKVWLFNFRWLTLKNKRNIYDMYG